MLNFNWKSGARSFNRRSLHHIGNGQNPYEQAISIIGRTLSAFDEDNQIPCFGFGDGNFACIDLWVFHIELIFGLWIWYLPHMFLKRQHMTKMSSVSIQTRHSVMDSRKFWHDTKKLFPIFDLLVQILFIPLLDLCIAFLIFYQLVLKQMVCILFLLGPTSFAPIIEMAITIVEQSGGQYHVLLIIADGQVIFFFWVALGFRRYRNRVSQLYHVWF